MAKSKSKSKGTKKRSGGKQRGGFKRGRRGSSSRGLSVRGFIQPGLLPMAAGGVAGMFAVPIIVSKIPVAALQSGMGNILATGLVSALLGGIVGKFAGRNLGMGLAVGGIAGVGVRAIAQWQASRSAPPPAAALRGYISDNGVSGYLDDSGEYSSEGVSGYVDDPRTYSG